MGVFWTLIMSVVVVAWNTVVEFGMRVVGTVVC